MRKLLLCCLTAALSATLTLAAPVTLVKYDEAKKELVVKEGKKGSETEATYTITDKTTFKEGDKDLAADKAVKRLSSPKAAGKARFEVVVKDKQVTEIKFPMPKPKADKNANPAPEKKPDAK